MLYVPAVLKDAVLALPAEGRLDEWAAPRARALEVDDPGILNNINTPDEWAAFLKTAGD